MTDSMIQGKQIADHSIAPSKIIGGVGGPVKVPFTFASASPIVLGPITPGTVVYLSQIAIEVAFNDPAATVEFGLLSNPGLFLGPGDVLANFVAQYRNSEALGPAVPDTLILTINPGTSTQGSGFLLYGETA